MDVLKDILGSKKHLVAVVAILIVALNRKLGLGLEDQEVKWIVAVAGSLIIGQGAADFGKGKLQAEQKATAKAANATAEREKLKEEIRAEIAAEGKTPS